jgi:hypothetical protein
VRPERLESISATVHQLYLGGFHFGKYGVELAAVAVDDHCAGVRSESTKDCTRSDVDVVRAESSCAATGTTSNTIARKDPATSTQPVIRLGMFTDPPLIEAATA